MGIGTWLGFFVGRRDAIRRVAGAPGLLGLGAVLVAGASLAREYDAEYLPANPWVLAISPAASLVAAFLLHAILWRSTRDLTPSRPFWTSFARLLGLFWLTAPLALLYAIPYERFLGQRDATLANLGTLGAVATWRVLLTIRTTSVAFDLPLRVAAVGVLLFSSSLGLAALMFSPWPVIDLMGGLRDPDSLDIILLQFRFLGILVSAFVSAVMFHLWPFRDDSPPSDDREAPSPEPIPPSAWVVGIVPLVALGTALAWTQPEQRNALEMADLVARGDAAQAVRRMVSLGPAAFPPHWRLPDPGAHSERDPEALDALETLDALGTRAWPFESYWPRFDRLYRVLQSSGRWRMPEVAPAAPSPAYAAWQSDVRRAVAILARLAPTARRNELVRDHGEALAHEVARSTPSVPGYSEAWAPLTPDGAAAARRLLDEAK